MDRIYRKLTGKQGASMVIALVFFLICAFAGGAVLAAAASNAGKATERKKSEQFSLALSSAARLMQEKIGSGNRLTVEDDGHSLTFSAPDGTDEPMLRFLYEPAVKQYLGGKSGETLHFQNFKFGRLDEPSDTSVFFAPSGELKISGNGSVNLGNHFPDVSVQYSIGLDYRMVYTFTAGDAKAPQSLRLEVNASKSTSADGATISWGSPEIRKGS